MIAQAVQPAEVFERRRKRDLGWYNNPGIDLTAKTIFPWLSDYLASGKTLYDPEFTTRYLDSMEKAFGSSLSAPYRYMTSLYMVIPPDFDPSCFAAARETFHVSGMYSSLDDFSSSGFREQYQAFPALGMVVVAKSGSLSDLQTMGILSRSQVDSLRESLKSSSTAMIGFWGGRVAPTFVIVAEKTSDVAPWIKQITGLTELKEGIQTRISGD